MESDTLHRMQAAVGSQIPPLVAALGGALSRLSEPQRRWLADDLVRDLQFIKKVCKELSASDELSGPTQLIAAFDKLEYIAERLATYYEHYKRQLETSVPRLTIHPLTPEERVAMKKWMRGMNAKGAVDFGERHIVARANKTIRAIEKMLGYLQEEVEGKIVTKRVIHADELTFVLGELAALAESVYQELRGMYRELWEASQPMPKRIVRAPLKALRAGRNSRKGK